MAKLEKDDVFKGEPVINQIIRDLEEVFPQRNPQPSDDISRIMYLAGQRSVDEYLINKVFKPLPEEELMKYQKDAKSLINMSY